MVTNLHPQKKKILLAFLKFTTPLMFSALLLPSTYLWVFLLEILLLFCAISSICPSLIRPFNYTETVTNYCHRFNLAYNGEVDYIQAGNETYIKVRGKNNFVFFFISSKNRKISAYHIEKSEILYRLLSVINDAIRTAKPEQEIVMATDANSSYPTDIRFINQGYKLNLIHKKFVGLQNQNKESE